jgi:hypothetical protein
MKATKENIDQFKPGMWYSVCCIEDLYQADEEDILEHKRHFYEDIEDGAYNWLMFWPSKEDAIKDLWNDNIPLEEETRKRLGIKL